MSSRRHCLAVTALALSSLACAAGANAAAVYYSFDLHGGPLGALPTPYISFIDSPVDSNADGYTETLLKITLNDPGTSNPYKFAQFRITYDGVPTGLSVNIGDSRSNNGGSGDSGTQSNDAELQVGALLGSPPSEFRRLQVLGNDNTPPGGKVVADVANFADQVSDEYITVGDGYAAWDDGRGGRGSAHSPYLFALNGQADSEGSVNYDIYAAFNRVIDGNYRIGAGVGQLTVCLSSDESCFNVVPLPGSLPLSVLALAALGFVNSRRARRPEPACG